MKHVIGKRNGKTIVSGGGSLEEQKNNLKHWEVLDEESSPAKEQYNKRIKIDPQDLYLIVANVNDAAYSTDTWFTKMCATNKTIGELKVLPSKYNFINVDTGETIETSTIKMNTDPGGDDYVLEESLAMYTNIYKPIKNKDGDWEYIIPVINGQSVIDRFDEKVAYTLCIGCPLHYSVNTDGEGNYESLIAPNNTSTEACMKKYNFYDSSRNGVNTPPSETAIDASVLIKLIYNPTFTGIQMTIDSSTGNTAHITKVDAVLTDTSLGLSNQDAVIGQELIPFQPKIDVDWGTTFNDDRFEIPKLHIVYKTIKDNA